MIAGSGNDLYFQASECDRLSIIRLDHCLSIGHSHALCVFVLRTKRYLIAHSTADPFTTIDSHYS